MKLVTFIPKDRGLTASWGALVGERVVDCGPWRGGRYPGITEVLADDALPALRGFVAESRPSLSLEDVELEPPVQSAGQKIICVGLNYADHRDEVRQPRAAYPTLFTRFPDTLIGAGATALCPSFSQDFDFEAELAVVIGRNAYQVRAGDVMSCIAGYTCFNDFSVRDWQWHTSQWTPGKNFSGTGAMGPYLVTRDEITDPHALAIELQVNDRVRQSANTSDMLFRIPDLIEYITTFTHLRPGDVVVSGTPAGVGAASTPPAFLRPGDVVTVQIEGVGTLENTVGSPSSGTVPALREPATDLDAESA